MSFYPNGNGDKGKGYISLYLNRINNHDDSDDPTDDVHVTFRFFIYDHIRNQYVIIQDSSVNKYESGNGIRTHGFARALSRSKFNRRKNGFVKNGCCNFGVDVFRYIPLKSLSATLVPYKEPNGKKSTRKHSWVSGKYRDLPEVTHSPKFRLIGRSWKIQVNPRGVRNHGVSGKCLSMYLQMQDTTDLVDGNNVFVKFQLRLKNKDPKKDITKTRRAWFQRGGTTGMGVPCMILLSKLTHHGYLINKCLSVEVIIKTYFIFKT